MGLDFKLIHKTYGEIIEGNGRSEFRFVRKWVESKKTTDFDSYGKYIQLTESDINWLINESFLEHDGKDINSFIDSCMASDSNGYVCNHKPLIKILLRIKGSKDYENYYLECDW